MPRLYIRMQSEARPLPEEEGYELKLQWLVTESDGSVRGHGVTDYRGLKDVADPNADWLREPDNTVVFIPAHYVLGVDCQVPGRSTAQIRRALPFAVEEFIAEDIESMHIAHALIRSGEPVACSLVRRDLITGWLTCLREAGINPGYMIADGDMLARTEGQISVLFEGSDALVAHAGEAALLPQAHLGLALASIEAERVITIGGTISDVDLAQMPMKAEVEQIDVDDTGVLGYLAQRKRDAEPRVNLLQGEFKPVRPRSPNAAKWQGVAALAALWLVVAFLGMVVTGFWADREADRLEAESFAFYKGMFPRESQPASLDQVRRRMAAKLGKDVAGASNSAEFVGLVAGLASALDAKHQVLSLSYSDQRQELNVEVMLGSYQDIDGLKDVLARSGVQMEPTNAEQVPTGVRSRMRLSFQG